jgi:CRP/FNR family transcriptional regulator, transcriptional activator FtrB
MTIDPISALKSLPLFQRLGDESLETVARACFVMVYPVNSLLQPQGQVPDSLFGLIKGAVELAAEDGKNGGAVSLVTPGQVFTLAAVLDDEMALTEARAVQKSIVLAVPAQLVRNLVETDHDFCRAALQHATRYSRDLVRTLHGHKLRTSVERLALWMLENSDDDGRIELPFSKRTLASLIGTTPESLSRVLAGLDGVVTRKPNRTYQIEDHGALVLIGRPSPFIAVR